MCDPRWWCQHCGSSIISLILLCPVDPIRRSVSHCVCDMVDGTSGSAGWEWQVCADACGKIMPQKLLPSSLLVCFAGCGWFCVFIAAAHWSGHAALTSSGCLISRNILLKMDFCGISWLSSFAPAVWGERWWPGVLGHPLSTVTLHSSAHGSEAWNHTARAGSDRWNQQRGGSFCWAARRCEPCSGSRVRHDGGGRWGQNFSRIKG